MASSSRTKNICFNEKCDRDMAFPRPGWNRNADICNQCFIAYRKKEFCIIYHKDSSDWSFCNVCNKKIHRGCSVSRGWYTTSKAGEMCNGCGPPNKTMVPQTLVATNELSVEKLPPSPKAMKRHPRHGPGCLCVVCAQPASGSKHVSSCVSTACRKGASKTTLRTSSSRHSGDFLCNIKKKVIMQNVNIIIPPEPKNDNTVEDSDDHPKANRGLHSKIVLFDLNLPPEEDEDFMDTMN